MFNAEARKDYARSNETAKIDVNLTPAIVASAGRIRLALAARDPALVMAAALTFIGALCDEAEIPRIPVKIAPRRKKAGRSEYDGCCGPKGITIHLRTAERGRFIAFRTLLKTVCHEFAHHYDWKSLGLSNSFHTRGFQQRVNALYRGILDALEKPKGA